ncbi:MAG: acyl carrier protein [Acidobacteriota bacterium]
MTPREDIVNELRILAEAVLSSGGTLHPGDRLAGRGLDSVAMVGLLSSVEERFGVSIPPEEITPENFSTVTALATLVSRLQE